MNVGIIMLALMLVAGSILGIIMIAGQNQDPFVDTFGDVQSNETNATQSTVTNVTSPLMGAAGGLSLFLGAMVIFIAAIILVVSVKSSLNGRR